MTPRDAVPEDYKAIANLLTGWAASTSWLPRVHSRRDELHFAKILIERRLTRVIDNGQRLLGFLARDGSEIHGVYVTPFSQNRGIGRRLIDDAKSRQPNLGLYVFQQNTAAQRFYLQNQFLETSRSNGRENDEQLPEIRFQWAA